ncbi:MAG: hypothetical protein LBJ80_00140 [Rickettsiales bacterium]|nr:hypothetical protein [Rickettsiales bacterium]
MDDFLGLGSLWNFAQDIFKLNKASKAITGTIENKKLALEAASRYQEQADVLYNQGLLNEGIMYRAGRIAFLDAVRNTYSAVSAQKVLFLNRGIELAGSPQMILDETIARGMTEARERAFEAETAGLNERSKATGPTHYAQEAKRAAQAQAKGAKASLLDAVFDTGNVINQMVNRNNPATAYFQNLTKT